LCPIALLFVLELKEEKKKTTNKTTNDGFVATFNLKMFLPTTEIIRINYNKKSIKKTPVTG